MAKVRRFVYVYTNGSGVVHKKDNRSEGPTWCGRHVSKGRWHWIVAAAFHGQFRHCKRCGG